MQTDCNPKPLRLQGPGSREGIGCLGTITAAVGARLLPVECSRCGRVQGASYAEGAADGRRDAAGAPADVQPLAVVADADQRAIAGHPAHRFRAKRASRPSGWPTRPRPAPGPPDRVAPRPGSAPPRLRSRDGRPGTTWRASPCGRPGMARAFPGRSGRLLTRTPHSPGRADFRHPVLLVMVSRDRRSEPLEVEGVDIGQEAVRIGPRA